MKRLAFISITLGALAFTACQQDPDGFSDVSLDELDISTEVAAEASLEEIDLIAEAGMETLNESSGGRMGRDDVLDCAEVTWDYENQVITVDFGDGCEGPNGVIKSGKMFIEYDQRKYLPGAYRIITFEDFFVDSVQVEGVRKLVNTTDSTSTLRFEVTLTGGKLSFPDGTTYTREGEHIRNWFRTEDRQNDYATLTGTADGVNRRSLDYQVEILEELVFTRACRRGRIIVPVSGVIQKTVGDKVATIDFGDGECDNIAVVTVDGESKRIEIHPRGRKGL